jgi:hypothetical protein
LLGEDRNARELTQDETAGVAEHRRGRQPRQLPESDRAGARQLVSERAQARSQHHGDGRDAGRELESDARGAGAVERKIRPARHLQESVQEKDDERLVGTRSAGNRVI